MSLPRNDRPAMQTEMPVILAAAPKAAGRPDFVPQIGRMRMRHVIGAMTLIAGLASPAQSNAEILAMLNYESKSADALKAFKSPGAGRDAHRRHRRRSTSIRLRPISARSSRPSRCRRTSSRITSSTIAMRQRPTSRRLGKPELRVIDMCEAAVHRENRRGAGLPGRRGRRVLRRQQALVPDLHGLGQPHHRRRGERHADARRSRCRSPIRTASPSTTGSTACC